MKHRRILIAILACILFSLAVSGCGEEPVPETEPVLELVFHATAENIHELDTYPDLVTLDLRGSDCYEEILGYMAAHPSVDVAYDVAIGSARYTTDTESLEFTADQLDFDSLIQNLKYLPNVKNVFFPAIELPLAQLEELRTSYPDVTFDYTVEIAEVRYDADATEVDLTLITTEDLDAVIGKLAYLPAVTNAALTDADGNNHLTPADVKTLQQQCPGIFFDYGFELFGKIVTTSDERIEYDEILIGNEGEPQIREALDILTSCNYIKFDDCGIDSTVMAGIRDDYPNVKVVWRIHIEQYSLLTDETMMRLTFVLEDNNIEELKYCTDIVYLDIGHNETLTDVSFMAYMPNLECAILSGSIVSDISPLANCKKLIWLELCFCGYLTDLSPIQNLDSLKYLNISYTNAKDYSPLMDLDLDRFVCMGTRASMSEKNKYVNAHPDCLSVTKGKQPYGYGWRYDDHGYTFFEYYRNMRKIFRYDDKNYRGNIKES